MKCAYCRRDVGLLQGHSATLFDPPEWWGCVPCWAERKLEQQVEDAVMDLKMREFIRGKTSPEIVEYVQRYMREGLKNFIRHKP